MSKIVQGKAKENSKIGEFKARTASKTSRGHVWTLFERTVTSKPSKKNIVHLEMLDFSTTIFDI